MTPAGARRRPVVTGALGLLAALTVLFAACSSGGSDGADGDSPSTTYAPTPTPTPTDYSGPGPYPVGTAELTIGDQSVYLYYPADPARLGEGTPVTGYSSADAFPDVLKAIVPPQLIQQIPLDATLDAPIAEGPFPVVLYSHGFASYPEYSALHLAHLASWGFVAAAPDHTSSDLAAVALNSTLEGDEDVVDLRATLDLLRSEGSAGGRFAGAIDVEQVAAEGHSAGGGAAARLVNDPDIDTFIGQAPASPLDPSASGVTDDAALAATYAETAPPQKPSMIIAAERDGIIPLTGIDAEYAWLAPPKRYAVLANAGHNAFTDLCKPIREQGGLSQLTAVFPAGEILFRLGEDGCTDGYADPAATYRVIDHLTVAQLRWVFGTDPTDASLTPEYVESLFPGALARYESEGSTGSGQG